MMLEESFVDCEKDKWVLDQNKPELSLAAKMMKLMLSCFEHIIRRQDLLEKMVLL